MSKKMCWVFVVIVLLLLLSFYLIINRYQPFETFVPLNQSSIDSINIEMAEPYEEYNVTITSPNAISDITAILKNLEISKYRKKEGTYKAEPIYKYKIIIDYTNSTPSIFILTLNSRYIVIDNEMYKIKNGEELRLIYDIIT